MGPWLIVLVGVIYAYIAAESVSKGDTSLAIIFAGYAASNIGLFMVSSR